MFAIIFLLQKDEEGPLYSAFWKRENDYFPLSFSSRDIPLSDTLKVFLMQMISQKFLVSRVVQSSVIKATSQLYCRVRLEFLMILCTNSLLLLKSSGSKEHCKTYILYLLLFCYTIQSPIQISENFN